MAECKGTRTFLFGQVGHRQVVADFRGGEIVTDAGLLPLKKLDEKLCYMKRVSALIHDRRNPLFIVHEQVELLRQRMFGIIAGYEDCNDASRLRHDPAFKLLVGKKNWSDPLASQPTLCRLEHVPSADEIEALNDFLTDFYIQEVQARRSCRRQPPSPTRIMLDADSTDDPCYGRQQLIAFNGHYDQYMYLPLLIFEGYSGYLLGVKLRSGTAPNSQDLSPLLQRRIHKLRRAWPHVILEFRADAGFQDPLLFDFLEEQDVTYAIGLASNDVLKRAVAELQRRAQEFYEQTHQPQRMYMSFKYAAESWGHTRRVCAKVEHNLLGENTRFVVTTRAEVAQEVFDWYNQRGECENRIEELKNDLRMDKLSCEEFQANAFRLMLHALTYNFICSFRRHMSLINTDLSTATVATLRWKLFKIGALVQQTGRRIWIHMSSSWPFRHLYEQACLSLGP